jgi:exonuclease III
MKIISWNVANRSKRQSLQLDALLSRKPNVISLQEVTKETLPFWVDGLSKAGYKYIISSFDIHNKREIFVGPRRYGIFIASRWPMELIESCSLKIPWQERLLSVLIHSQNIDFEFHTAYIPPGSSNGWIKIDTFEGIYKFLVNNEGLPRILCGDFNSPQAETRDGQVITWGQKILRDGQLKFIDQEGRWDAGERCIIQGLAKYDLSDIFRLLNGYNVQEFSWLLKRKGKIIAKRRFDHIFASKELNPKVCHYLHSLRDNKLSDHSAIEGAFEI